MSYHCWKYVFYCYNLINNLLKMSIFSGAKTQKLSELISINEVPIPYRDVFSEYSTFNRVQSKVFNEIFNTDKSLVVSAPTGSGKTVLFELAIIRLLLSINEDFDRNQFKIIYVSPVKSLCQERLMDWHKKFATFGISCISITGDSEFINFSTMQNNNLIITTPEKWDSLTRKWKDNKKLVQVIKLFLIDEVHLLNEDSRGSTLEVIVSRMKTIEDRCDKIRFVALSATVSNIEDISNWIGKAPNTNYYRFSEDMRPVPLKKIVIGYHYEAKNGPFKFDLSLNYRLQNLMIQYSEGKPTLIFCSTRKSVEMTSKHIVQNLTINLSPVQKKRLQDAADAVNDVKAKQTLVHGVGFHHAGMIPETKHAVENLFRNGDLPVLVTTSTLAMGVNLPAHLVIIKSTKCYKQMGFEDYTEAQILQMIGRAGRPQFDTTATAIILTSHQDKPKFENMVGGIKPIESNLHRHLIEHLNAEIVLGTITDLDVAMQWLASTFLHLRARKNPAHYGFSIQLTAEQIDKKLLEMCQIELNKLLKAGMITMDTLDISPTPTGTIMAKYCVAFETMKLFTKINGGEVLQQILALISKCSEFSEMCLRVDDKKILNTYNMSKGQKTIRFPLNGRIKTLDMKINCITQAVFGCLDMNDHSILADSFRIMKIGERIANCLTEYLQTRTECYLALLNSIILAKCFHAKLWENSQYVVKQLPGIGAVMSNQMVAAGKVSFQKILDTNPRELELITKKKCPFGNNIIDTISKIPKYEMKVEKVIKDNVFNFKINLSLLNALDIQNDCTVNINSIMSLLVGDSENEILLYEQYTHSYMLDNPDIEKYVEVTNQKTSEINAHFLSENWVGIDCNSKIIINDTSKATKTNEKNSKSNKDSKNNENDNPGDNTYIQMFMDMYMKVKKNPNSTTSEKSKTPSKTPVKEKPVSNTKGKGRDKIAKPHERIIQRTLSSFITPKKKEDPTEKNKNLENIIEKVDLTKAPGIEANGNTNNTNKITLLDNIILKRIKSKDFSKNVSEKDIFLSEEDDLYENFKEFSQMFKENLSKNEERAVNKDEIMEIKEIPENKEDLTVEEEFFKCSLEEDLEKDLLEKYNFSNKKNPENEVSEKESTKKYEILEKCDTNKNNVEKEVSKNKVNLKKCDITNKKIPEIEFSKKYEVKEIIVPKAKIVFKKDKKIDNSFIKKPIFKDLDETINFDDISSIQKVEEKDSLNDGFFEISKKKPELTFEDRVNKPKVYKCYNNYNKNTKRKSDTIHPALKFEENLYREEKAPRLDLSNFQYGRSKKQLRHDSLPDSTINDSPGRKISVDNDSKTSKSIKWRSPLVNSPTFKHSPKITRTLQTLMEDVEEDFSSDFNESVDRTPLKLTLTSKRKGTQFPLCDKEYSQNSNDQNLDSSAEKDDFSEFFSASFLENVGINRKPNQIKRTQPVKNQNDYYSQFVNESKKRNETLIKNDTSFSSLENSQKPKQCVDNFASNCPENNMNQGFNENEVPENFNSIQSGMHQNIQQNIPQISNNFQNTDPDVVVPMRLKDIQALYDNAKREANSLNSTQVLPYNPINNFDPERNNMYPYYGYPGQQICCQNPTQNYNYQNFDCDNSSISQNLQRPRQNFDLQNYIPQTQNYNSQNLNTTQNIELHRIHHNSNKQNTNFGNENHNLVGRNIPNPNLSVNSQYFKQIPNFSDDNRAFESLSNPGSNVNNPPQNYNIGERRFANPNIITQSPSQNFKPQTRDFSNEHNFLTPNQKCYGLSQNIKTCAQNFETERQKQLNSNNKNQSLNISSQNFHRQTKNFDISDHYNLGSHNYRTDRLCLTPNKNNSSFGREAQNFDNEKQPFTSLNIQNPNLNIASQSFNPKNLEISDQVKHNSRNYSSDRLCLTPNKNNARFERETQNFGNEKQAFILPRIQNQNLNISTQSFKPQTKNLIISDQFKPDSCTYSTDRLCLIPNKNNSSFGRETQNFGNEKQAFTSSIQNQILNHSTQNLDQSFRPTNQTLRDTSNAPLWVKKLLHLSEFSNERPQRLTPNFNDTESQNFGATPKRKIIPGNYDTSDSLDCLTPIRRRNVNFENNPNKNDFEPASKLVSYNSLENTRDIKNNIRNLDSFENSNKQNFGIYSQNRTPNVNNEHYYENKKYFDGQRY